MKPFLLIIALSCMGISQVVCQNMDTLPYYEMGEYPKEFTPETTVARLIDGLGFRYHWATESLRPQDLSFKPTQESRTSEETIDHILELSEFILKPIKGEIMAFNDKELKKLSFDEKRKRTLNNLKEASDLLLSGKVKLDKIKIRMKGSKNEFPFWHELNGQIADALWHTGQVVSFRRSSGNPFDGKADVFMGKYGKH